MTEVEIDARWTETSNPPSEFVLIRTLLAVDHHVLLVAPASPSPRVDSPRLVLVALGGDGRHVMVTK
jgi:hypothetical protein